MEKIKLIEMMEKINPDMEISYDNMVDLMMDDVKYIKKYQDRINELDANETLDILIYNPQSYELLKNHAKDVFGGQQVARLKAVSPELADKFKDMNYLISPSHIHDVIKYDPNKLTVFSDILKDDEWLERNEGELRGLLRIMPELKKHPIFNRAKVLQHNNLISVGL